MDEPFTCFFCRREIRQGVLPLILHYVQHHGALIADVDVCAVYGNSDRAWVITSDFGFGSRHCPFCPFTARPSSVDLHIFVRHFVAQMNAATYRYRLVGIGIRLVSPVHPGWFHLITGEY